METFECVRFVAFFHIKLYDPEPKIADVLGAEFKTLPRTSD